MQSDLANNIVSWAVGAPAVGVVIAYGISIIRRRMATDIKSAKEDKEYSNMLETYKKERDTIREDRDRTVARIIAIEAERNEAVSLVGKLGAEVQFLSVQVTELKVLVERLGTSLEQSRNEMNKVAVENARLSSHVTHLESIVEQRKKPRDSASH